MSDSIISVENLGKSYVISHQGSRGEGLRHRAEHLARSPIRWLRAALTAGGPSRNGNGHVKPPVAFSAPGKEEFWALKDLNFEIKRGEVVGIIGRNGAGKSTLLKILSRITEPTTGRVVIDGRVASLLEVGTGFHPELTGRENIFLNGAILGMSKAEIKKKFEEIVAFAETEKFLDTPVKHYSSGMYVRLAFAVAAHLEPEILIVDEVLAVGDAQFQKKCLGKMGEVAKGGRTVLFVSHTMSAIQGLCQRATLLDKGSILHDGEPFFVVGKYMADGSRHKTAQAPLLRHPGRPKSYQTLMRQVELLSEKGTPSISFPMGSSLSVRVVFSTESHPLAPVLGVAIRDIRGTPILGVNNRFIPGSGLERRVGAGSITCHLNKIPLMPGSYFVDLYFGDAHEDFDVVLDAISFEVFAADVFGTGKLPSATTGAVFWPAEWTLQ